jgi:uncharacterized protein YjiK
MTAMRRICGLVVTLGAVSGTGCAARDGGEIEPYIGADKADGSTHRLKQIDRHRIDIEEPSDLVQVGEDLFAVSDQHSKIYELSARGRIKDTTNIEGRDLEAIAFDVEHDEFVVADESSAKIWRIDHDGHRHDAIEIDDADDGNSGIEGLAFDDRGHLFVAKEKNPARIIELDDSGDQVDSRKIDFADDLSALAFNASDERLYALSDEEHTLYRLDKDLDVDTAWRLPIQHPEGIAFDGDRIYIVSDSEQRLYVFEQD